jgi:hypothetical protein
MNIEIMANRVTAACIQTKFELNAFRHQLELETSLPGRQAVNSKLETVN